ncbi:MAG TPA: GH25 family lysozyme [Polyangiaceae bacterium]|nr:GH25 family lysozyme [Polyangiaceae bacterium]
MCATGATVKGIDVSKYQGTIDWSKVAAAGIKFGFARVSDGTQYPDSFFAANWKNMKAQGLVRGVYQFFRASQDPIAQADLLLTDVTNAGGFVPGDLPPVIDVETADGQTDTTVRARMQAWLDHIQSAIGRKPIIYSGPSHSAMLGNGFTSYPLWVPNWGVSCPNLTSSWTTWTFWQDSDQGSVSGVAGAVDTDLFNGSLSELQAFASEAASDAGAPSGDAGASATDASASDASATSTPDASAPPTDPCAP